MSSVRAVFALLAASLILPAHAEVKTHVYHVTALARATETSPSILARHRSLDRAFGVGIRVTRPPIAPGDQLVITYRINAKTRHDEECLSIERLGSVAPIAPKRVTAREHYAMTGPAFIRLEGIVLEAFIDEIDPNIILMALHDGTDAFYVNGFSCDADLDTLASYVGKRVAVEGISTSNHSNPRRQVKREIFVPNLSTIELLEPDSTDIFNAPSLDRLMPLRPNELPVASRHRAIGRVAAVRRGMRLVYLRKPDGNLIRVSCLGQDLPSGGETIEAVGLPETDLYRLNLTCAFWRPCATNLPPEKTDVGYFTARQIFTDKFGSPRINRGPHGERVLVKGTVADLPRPDDPASALTLVSDGYPLSVDISCLGDLPPNLAPKAEIAVTGLYVVETETWQPHLAYPHTTNVTLVLADPRDLVVTAPAPWWTHTRLLWLAVTLGALFVVFAALSLILRRLVERRGRELARATIARTASELKVYERTRLAVELHDSVSQNLTGVALELQTAAASEPLSDGTRRHLDIARKTLGSCRDELRNCLWDLRHNTLEADAMDEALRQTLAPLVGAARLSVRFNVPRNRLTDNTAQNILRIVRELVTNALRHGHAKTVCVAGCIDGGRLLFSVADDGCGFDPDNCPGIEQGHFGLLGVRERIEGLGGTLEIASSRAGSKITASITMPTEGIS